MSRGRQTALIVTLTPEESQTLHAWQRALMIPAGLARRGRMLLLLHEGMSISAVAMMVGINRRFVYKWAQRFLTEGLAGLEDRPRTGRQTGIRRHLEDTKVGRV